MALMAIIISVSLSSCGDDDSNSPETPINPKAKHITRIVQEEEEDDGDKFRRTYNYTYDSQGRVTTLLRESSTTNEFIYNGNIISEKNNGKDYYTYTLLNGRVATRIFSSSNEETTFSYDNQGYNTGATGSFFSSTCFWAWGDLKEIEMTTYTAGSVIESSSIIEYSNYLAPVNYFPIGLYVLEEAPLAMVGYFGKMPIHLISSITENYQYQNINRYGKKTTTYKYQIQDGLPINIDYTEVYTYKNKPPKTTRFGKITIEWN